MARFLLIHGAAHGAWCWRAVLPALAALGHEAQAIDLPSHGDDPADPGSTTLQDYATRITQSLSAPTILVGHSMGGYAITAAAETAAAPAQITRLIYLCAYTPWPGLSLARMRMQAKTQPLLPALRMAGDRRSFTMDPTMAPDLFYHDCTAEDVAFALSRLTPQGTAPSATPVTLSDRSQSLPRSYILCEKDRTIPPEFQRRMADRFAPQDVHSLPASHSPFFSMPDRLADMLHAIAT